MEKQEKFFLVKLKHCFGQVGEDELEGKNIYPIYSRLISPQGEMDPSDLLGFFIVDVLSECPEIDPISIIDDKGVIFLVVMSNAFLWDDDFLSKIYDQEKPVFLVSPGGEERDVFERFIRAWKILSLEQQAPFAVCGYKGDDSKLVGRIVNYFF